MSVAPVRREEATGADDVLATLDPEQRAVAEALIGPVCVLAGAGTGKTRAITHRIAYGVRTGTYVPQRVLAVTFTTRAAGEMRDRLRRLGADGVQARTFHSAALRQLRFFWPDTVGGDQPRIVDTKAPLVAEAASRTRLRPDSALVRDLAAEIEWAKVSRVSADGYADAAIAGGRDVATVDAPTVGRVYAAYDEVKRARGLFDFEDVLLFVVAMLEDSPRVAAQVRGQYRHLVVDEYQDVNPLQQRLLELWLGDRNEICVVGDPSQTIYSFAGARQDYLLDFPRRYPTAEVVRLERNYRSTAPVLTLANRVLAGARSRAGFASTARLTLRSERGDGPVPTFSSYPDEPAEAAGVADRISGLLRSGMPARDIAVLYRINAQAVAYEQALTEAGVPYVLRGGERFFDRPEVRQAITLVRGAARAGSEAGPLGASVRSVLMAGGWSQKPPSGSGAVRARWESLAALAQLADDVAAVRPDASLTDFVDEVSTRAAMQHAPFAEGVTLATLHAAKGLEWEAVFLIGLTDGAMPLIHAEGADQIEEERRLFYVGLTRARTHLALSWALARSPGGRASRSPSWFLDGIRPSEDLGRVDARTGRSRTPRRERAPALCRVCGRALAGGAERKLGRCASCPSNADEAVFDRLRAWRSSLAKELSLPAYCVFTDATLLAIAELAPTTTAELAGVAGVGKVKLDRYGTAMLSLCGGGDDAGETAAGTGSTVDDAKLT